MESVPAVAMPPASELSGLSEASLRELQKDANERPDSSTLAFFPISAVLLFLLLDASAHLIAAVLMRTSQAYRSLSTPHRRNSVIYILSLVYFYTTLALSLQLVAAPSLARLYTKIGIDCLRLAGLVVCALYLYEMAYRERMNRSMRAHHISTIFAICFVVGVLADSKRPSIITTAIIWLFQGTTEQPVFVALLTYRLKADRRKVVFALRFAAVQSFFFKVLFAIYMLAWWGVRQSHHHETTLDRAFSAVLWIAIALLMVTQWYGTSALWSISNRVAKEATDGRGESVVERGTRPADKAAGHTVHNQSGAMSTGQTTLVDNSAADGPRMHVAEGGAVPEASPDATRAALDGSTARSLE